MMLFGLYIPAHPNVCRNILPSGGNNCGENSDKYLSRMMLCSAVERAVRDDAYVASRCGERAVLAALRLYTACM